MVRISRPDSEKTFTVQHLVYRNLNWVQLLGQRFSPSLNYRTQMACTIIVCSCDRHRHCLRVSSLGAFSSTPSSSKVTFKDLSLSTEGGHF